MVLTFQESMRELVLLEGRRFHPCASRRVRVGPCGGEGGTEDLGRPLAPLAFLDGESVGGSAVSAEFYDMLEDPGERVNLLGPDAAAPDPALRALVSEMLDLVWSRGGQQPDIPQNSSARFLDLRFREPFDAEFLEAMRSGPSGPLGV